MTINITVEDYKRLTAMTKLEVNPKKQPSMPKVVSMMHLVYSHETETLRAEATDGVGYVQVDIKATAFFKGVVDDVSKHDFDIITDIPKVSTTGVVSVSIEVGTDSVKWSFIGKDGVQVSCALTPIADGKYPNLKSCIQSETKPICTLDAKMLAKLLQVVGKDEIIEIVPLKDKYSPMQINICERYGGKQTGTMLLCPVCLPE